MWARSSRPSAISCFASLQIKRGDEGHREPRRLAPREIAASFGGLGRVGTSVCAVADYQRHALPVGRDSLRAMIVNATMAIAAATIT